MKKLDSEESLIRVYSVDDYLRSEQKKLLLEKWGAISGVPLQTVLPDKRNTWITAGQQEDFAHLLPLGDKASKGLAKTEAVFRLFSLGLATNRDEWVYSHDVNQMRKHVRLIGEAVEKEAAKYKTLTKEERKSYQPAVIDHDIKWTDRLVNAVRSNPRLTFKENSVRTAMYRPFESRYVYFDHLLNQRRYQQHRFFPAPQVMNTVLCVNTTPGSSEFFCLAVSRIPDLHLTGDTQCFPVHTYDPDGINRQDNITDWALDQYSAHYSDPTITKWNIFHAIYALLHHPEYRTRYAANLKRELPRIPFPPDLRAFAEAGERLMELHTNYEKQPEYKLHQIEDEKAEVSFRVTRMRVNPKDRSELKYNDFLTLRGIPLDVYDYRLGNRSALEWVVDQYRVTTDARSGITNDPNREDDKKYILRLIGQVITVSLETNEIVKNLPALGLDGSDVA